MRALLKAVFVAAGLLLSAHGYAAAQSFEQMTKDGQDAFKRGDYQRALDLRLRQLPMQAKDPRDHCLVYWGLFTAYVDGLGDMEKGLKAVDDSIACLNAIADNSQDMLEIRAEAWRYRAHTLRDWGRYDEALAAADQMAKVLPSAAAQAEINRGMTYEAKGDFKAAAVAFEHGAAGQVFWKRQAIWMKVREGKAAEAIADLAALERSSPRTAGNDTNMLAWIYAEQGQYDAAAAALKADEKAGGGDGTIYTYLRGYVEAARGNFAEAAQAFWQGGAQQTGNPTVATAAYLAFARGGGTQLPDVSRLAGKLNPSKWPDSQLFYAAGLIDRGQFEATAKIGNPRMEATRLCRASLVAGEVALIAGDKATAKQELTRAVSTCTIDPAAQERTWARGELARLDGAQAAAAKPTAAMPAAGNDICAAATAHWTSAESIGTRAAYEDHLARFSSCAFATLAAARIAALDQTGPAPAAPSRLPPPEKSAVAPNCAPGLVRDSDGDCVRAKPKQTVKRSAPRRAASSSEDEGETKQVLDCSTPAGLFACANRELSKLPGARP